VLTTLRRVRVALLCGVLLLAAPASAPAATRPALGIVDVASGHRTVLAHATEGWSSLRWTADGSALLSVALERRGLVVRRYALAGGTRVARDLGEAIDGVLSWDGKLVAALYDGGQGIAGGRGGVVVREVATGRALLRLPQHAEGDELYENGLEFAWSRDGSRLAYMALERSGRTLRIADVPGRRVLRRFDAARISLDPEAFSPAGDRLAYAAAGNGRLTLLDLASGSVQRSGEADLFAVAWAPPGERLAASRDGGMMISDEQRRFGPPQAAGETVDVLRWSPDGTMVALRLINDVSDYRMALAVMPAGASPGPPRLVVPYRRGGIGAFMWSPDGRRIAYAG
jgi:dipeptidyl aminopeptidase/acylaminoacyl peptidase